MNPTSLPFEYPFQWDNESLREGAGVSPEGAAILKQRDRDLEDFLATLGGGGGAPPTVFVAASDASPRSRAIAHFLCDGADDDSEINEALTEVNALGGGRVLLSEGTFTLGRTGIGDLLPVLANVKLQGLGMAATTLNHTGTAANGVAVGSYGGNFHLADLTVDATNITDGGYGVYLDLSNNSITRCRFIELGTSAVGGVVLLGDNNRVQDCQFRDFRPSVPAAIYAASGDNAIITGNTFVTMAEQAIYCDTDYSIVDSNVIRAAQDYEVSTAVITVRDYSIVTSNVVEAAYSAVATIAQGVGCVVANNVLL